MAENRSIEVTDSMVSAGIEALEKRFDAMSPYDDPRSLITKAVVMEIYLAMISAEECVSP